jgi:hypothetical protein
MRATPLVGPKLTGDDGKSYGRSWTDCVAKLFAALRMRNNGILWRAHFESKLCSRVFS